MVILHNWLASLAILHIIVFILACHLVLSGFGGSYGHERTFRFRTRILRKNRTVAKSINVYLRRLIIDWFTLKVCMLWNHLYLWRVVHVSWIHRLKFVMNDNRFFWCVTIWMWWIANFILFVLFSCFLGCFPSLFLTVATQGPDKENSEAATDDGYDYDCSVWGAAIVVASVTVAISIATSAFWATASATWAASSLQLTELGAEPIFIIDIVASC